MWKKRFAHQRFKECYQKILFVNKNNEFFFFASFSKFFKAIDQQSQFFEKFSPSPVQLYHLQKFQQLIRKKTLTFFMLPVDFFTLSIFQTPVQLISNSTKHQSFFYSDFSESLGFCLSISSWRTHFPFLIWRFWFLTSSLSLLIFNQTGLKVLLLN